MLTKSSYSIFAASDANEILPSIKFHVNLGQNLRKTVAYFSALLFSSLDIVVAVAAFSKFLTFSPLCNLVAQNVVGITSTRKIAGKHQPAQGGHHEQVSTRLDHPFRLPARCNHP